MIGTIIIGILAGWLAGKLMQGAGYGLLGDLILGLIGGVLGGWIFAQLKVAGPEGIIGSLVVATIGATILVWITHLVRRV
jgi:uncharacterized membrane protein YeaQ/YmgE (transglycosylase-associated protein family)